MIEELIPVLQCLLNLLPSDLSFEQLYRMEYRICLLRKMTFSMHVAARCWKTISTRRWHPGLQSRSAKPRQKHLSRVSPTTPYGPSHMPWMITPWP